MPSPPPHACRGKVVLLHSPRDLLTTLSFLPWAELGSFHVPHRGQPACYLVSTSLSPVTGSELCSAGPSYSSEKEEGKAWRFEASSACVTGLRGGPSVSHRVLCHSGVEESNCSAVSMLLSMRKQGWLHSPFLSAVGMETRTCFLFIFSRGPL